MGNLLHLLKVDRPGPSLEAVGRVFQGLNDPQAAGYDLATLLTMLKIGAGIGFEVQVNDCETNGDFTESDTGVFDIAAAAATGKRVGTNCMKLSSTAATDGTQYVDTVYINESTRVPLEGNKRQMDWTDTRYLGFWKHAESSSHFGTDGELQVAIVNNGTLQTAVNVDGTSGTVHHWCQIDMESNSWSRNMVESLRFYGNNSNTEDTYIDNIVRYDIAHDRGPLYGCAFPIKSAEALSDGDTVGWSIDGLVKSSSAAAVTDLGPVKLFTNGLPVSSLTGTAARGEWGLVPGMYIVIGRANAACTAGDFLEWAANGLYTDVTTAATEKGFAIALEAAGAQYDDIFILLLKGGASD